MTNLLRLYSIIFPSVLIIYSLMANASPIGLLSALIILPLPLFTLTETKVVKSLKASTIDQIIFIFTISLYIAFILSALFITLKP